MQWNVQLSILYGTWYSYYISFILLCMMRREIFEHPIHLQRNPKNAWLSLLYECIVIYYIYHIILFFSYIARSYKRLKMGRESFRHHRRYQKLSFPFFPVQILCAHSRFLITITWYVYKICFIPTDNVRLWSGIERLKL